MEPFMEPRSKRGTVGARRDRGLTLRRSFPTSRRRAAESFALAEEPGGIYLPVKGSRLCLLGGRLGLLTLGGERHGRSQSSVRSPRRMADLVDDVGGSN